MSFLDKIFGEKRETPKETKISLKDAGDFIATKIKKDFEPLREMVKKEYENLQLIANTMQDQLKNLEHATYPERTYPALSSRSVGSRKRFIEKMDFLIKKIQSPLGEDMNSILNFYDETDKLINATNAETTKEYVFLKILFEKEGKEILQSFRQIFEISNNLGKTIKEIRGYNSKLLKTKENVSEIIKLTEELKKDEINKLDKALKVKEDEIKKIENEIEKLLYSNDWKAFLEMQKVRDEMKLKIENKKSEFMDYMSKLEVPLKKYKWSVENNKILDDYAQKSFDSIIYEDPKGEVLTTVLKGIKIKLLEGKMKLKDSDKFMAIIESVKENNVIGNVIETYSRLLEELKNQEEKITLQEVSKRKIKLESELNRLKKEIEEIKDEERRVEERIKRIQANKEQKIRELEDLLNNVYGKRILLEVN
jgi:DNA repair exonuclease SbcCD ATPase subunit